MGGFFSKIINSLLGKKEEGTEKLKEVKAALSGAPKSYAKPNEEITDEEGSTIYRMVARAYRRGALFLAEKSKDRRALAIAGVIAAVLIVLLSYTSFFFYMRGIVLAIIFILLAALSKLIQKLFPFVVGFDLCLFFTVIFGIAYHPIAGMAVGVVSSAMGSVARGQYEMDKVIIPLLGYIAVGFLLMVFTAAASSVLYTGMIMALVYATMMSVIFWFIMQSIHNTLTFFITSIAFNYWLFSNYAGYFLMLMGASG